MIQVSNVTKVYTSDKGVLCKALDDVSFCLPDSGMVFVVGKSGCGKSTLLNIMGGLDKQTEGDISVDGESFSLFSERQFDNYRNSYVGFVFQNYYLKDSLTVWQNVALALQLQGQRNDEDVNTILQKVGIEDLSHRYPKQLSGGQCQRVAIARALIKEPRMVLADEPTGNLDSKIGRRVLEILKGYSRNHLVVIVSHNAADAMEFADRVIELADGKVVRDVERNPNAQDLCITDGCIAVQKGTVFSDEQLRQINECLVERPVKMVQVDDKFVPSQAVATCAEPKVIPNKKLSHRGKATLFSMFCRKQWLSLAVTMVLVICLVSLLGVCQMFLQFDSYEETFDLLQSANMEQFSLQKGQPSAEGHYNPIDYQHVVNIPDEQVQAFRDAGYKGNIYKMYNIPLTLSPDAQTLEAYRLGNSLKNCSEFFSKCGNGALACTKEYLASIYGDENGQLKVVGGDIDSPNVTEGVDFVVTDYIADSILKYDSSSVSKDPADPYAGLIGRTMSNRYRVGAVIDTGYKERYDELINLVAGGTGLDELQQMPQCTEFLNELSLTLNTAYSLNPNFAEDWANYDKSNFKNFCYLQQPSITLEDETYSNGTFYCILNGDVKAGEVKICKATWRSVTGLNKSYEDTEYWNSLLGKDVTFTVHNNATGEELTSITLKITGFVIKDGMRVSKETIKELRKYDAVPFALYFDVTSDVANLYKTGEPFNFYLPSMQYLAVQSVAGGVGAFRDFFVMIVVVLYVASALLLVYFGVRSIRKNVYEIGVLRALGTQTHNLAALFALQMFVLGLIIAVISVPAMYLGAKVGNSLLVRGFVAYSGNYLANNVTIIRFRPVTALVGMLLIIVLSMAASVVPILALRRIKPRQIINSKE